MKNITSLHTETATGKKLADEITDKRGYAARWGFSVRHIDNLLGKGLPHLRIGKRRVRIVVCEADKWMVETFGKRRIGRVSDSANNTEK